MSEELPTEPPRFEKLEKVYNFTRKSWGHVSSKPRPDNPMVFVRLHLGTGPTYYPRHEFFPPTHPGAIPPPAEPKTVAVVEAPPPAPPKVEPPKVDLSKIPPPPKKIEVPRIPSKEEDPPEAAITPSPVPVDKALHGRIDGEHMKSYIINYLSRDGTFKVEKVCAKGIVTAITVFYMQSQETAIVSVVCVL